MCGSDGSIRGNDARSYTKPETYLVMRFIQSLRPQGITTDAPPQYARPVCYEVPVRAAASSLRDCALCRHGYNNGPPLIFMRIPVTEFDTNSTSTADTILWVLSVTNSYTILMTHTTLDVGTRIKERCKRWVHWKWGGERERWRCIGELIQLSREVRMTYILENMEMARMTYILGRREYDLGLREAFVYALVSKTIWYEIKISCRAINWNFWMLQRPTFQVYFDISTYHGILDTGKNK